MTQTTNISCPCCGSVIIVDALMLVRGSRFSCSNAQCDASISMSSSSYEVAENALNKLEETRNVEL